MYIVDMNRILVIGAGGALGSQIVQQLEQRGETVIKGIYGDNIENTNSTRYVDVSSEPTIAEAVKGVGLVVVAVKQRQPLVQNVCVFANIPCVDVTVDYSFTEQVLDEYQDIDDAQLLVMCGFFPGLSAVMVESLASQFDEVSDITVGLLQNTNAKVGKTGVTDMLRKVTQPVEDGDTKIPAFSQSKQIDFGYDTGAVKVRLIRYDERLLLKQRYPDAVVGYYTAWNNKSFTRLIGVLQKTRILQFLLAKNVPLVPNHNPAKPETVHLAVVVTGSLNGEVVTKRVQLRADSDYVTTARFVAIAAQLVLTRQISISGVAFPFERIKLDDVVGKLGDDVEINRHLNIGSE